MRNGELTAAHRDFMLVSDRPVVLSNIQPSQDAAKQAGRDFDPLEFDRFTRFQELTRMLAESVGEWAFYAAVLLTVLALIRSVPARWFRKTHHWLAVAYLVLVYHTLVLVKPGYWSQPVGWVLAALLVAGTASAVLLLAGRAGRARALPAGSRALTA